MGSIATISQLILMATGFLNQLLARHAAATGKTEGQLLRESLPQIDANEVAALDLQRKALAQLGGAPVLGKEDGLVVLKAIKALAARL